MSDLDRAAEELANAYPHGQDALSLKNCIKLILWVMKAAKLQELKW